MILIKNKVGLHEQWEAGVRVATEGKKMTDSWESALKIRDKKVLRGLNSSEGIILGIRVRDTNSRDSPLSCYLLSLGVG